MLTFDRIMPVCGETVPGLSTFAAWGLRRIQRDCLFRDVADHLLRFTTQNQLLRLPCEQFDGATIYVITGFKIGHLVDFRSPCSPKCTALSRFREPQATALRLVLMKKECPPTRDQRTN